ncbi:MAG: XRE family transcriptional regulator [Bacteroidota bacterium]|nr:XRE family transcriptional regulator [Bacteroidota bacterium]MDP3144251.1 XRE family transcriptional regulator [Bacteroidota bacterium]
MSKISSNIRFLRQLKGLSQEQLADDLKVTRSRIGGYEEARNEPPIDLLIRISEYFHIAIDALVRGDLKKTNLDGLMKIGKNRILFPILIDSDGNDMVELIPLKASAGYTRGYADPDYIEKLPQMKLPFLPSGKHRAFPIKGDSMPPIREGSFVIAKYLEKFDEVKFGQTYIIVTKDDGLSYKRIMSFHKKEGAYELHSDNKLYQPFKVKASEILEIWEYTCCLNMNQYQNDELNLDSIMNMLKGLKVEISEIKKDKR